MDEANIIYVVYGLLYNLAGTVFVGMALFFRGFGDLLPKDYSHAVHDNQFLLERTRQNLDGSLGIILLFTGFALQAIGQSGQSTDSNINFLLVSLLFFLILVHFIYTRDIFAERYVTRRQGELSRTEKNRVYFGGGTP